MTSVSITKSLSKAAGAMAAAGALTRIMPAALLDVRRPQRFIERSAMVYLRGWLVFITGLFEPLFYLLSIRIGLANLVGDIDLNGNLVSYEDFVAPGLMAAAAMNGAVLDATMNVYFKWKVRHFYDSVLATPMSAADVVIGEIGFAAIRGMIYSVAFVVVMAVMGLVESPWIVLGIGVSGLIGFAFAALGMAATTFVRTWADFEYLPAITLPLFLFSATFVPISSYGNLGWLVRLSPLYHGVVVIRDLNLGLLSWGMLGHLAVLVAISIAGTAIAGYRIKKLLLV